VQLPTTFTHVLKHYLAGVAASSFNGGISAVSGILGIDGASMVGAPVQVLDWKAMLCAFIGGVVFHGLMWLKVHPLPETYESESAPTSDLTSQTK
jgi:hypothetical protein